MQPSSDQPVSDEERQRYYAHVLASFERYNKYSSAGFIGALVMMAAGLGRIDGRPPDITSLAHTLGIPYATAYRKARRVESLGFVKLVKKGRRVLVLSTLAGEHDEDDFQRLVDSLIQALKQPAVPRLDHQRHTFLGHNEGESAS